MPKYPKRAATTISAYVVIKILFIYLRKNYYVDITATKFLENDWASCASAALTISMDTIRARCRLHIRLFEQNAVRNCCLLKAYVVVVVVVSIQRNRSGVCYSISESMTRYALLRILHTCVTSNANFRITKRMFSQRVTIVIFKCTFHVK